MQTKIYNENGVVKVTKVLDTGKEMTMFSNIKPGDAASIEIDPCISIKAAIDITN